MKDIFCTDSLKTGRYASGPRLVAQRLYRALTSPRGCLRGSPDDELWGDDLTEVIGKGGPKDTERLIRGKISRAASKDEQILSTSVGILTSDLGAGAYSQEIKITAETSSGPFELVLAISDVSVSLLGIS